MRVPAVPHGGPLWAGGLPLGVNCHRAMGNLECWLRAQSDTLLFLWCRSQDCVAPYLSSILPKGSGGILCGLGKAIGGTCCSLRASVCRCFHPWASNMSAKTSSPSSPDTVEGREHREGLPTALPMPS